MHRHRLKLLVSLSLTCFLFATDAFCEPTLQATQSAALTDTNGDSVPNPGEQIQYTVTVSNNSNQDAANVAFTDSTDPNITVLSTPKIASSGAFDDCYGTSASTTIAPNATIGVLANDLSGLTITPGNVTTTQGVTVAIAADGSFSYTPPTNFTGTDTFVYSATDADGGINQGTVSIVVLGTLGSSDVSALQSITGLSGTTGLVTSIESSLNTIGSGLTGAGSSPTTAGLVTSLGTVQTLLDSNATANITAGINALRGLVDDTTAVNLKAAVNAVRTAIDGQTAASITDAVTALNTLIGGSGNTSARLTSVSGKILATPTGNITTDFGTARSLLVTTPGSSLQADTQTLNTALNNTSTGSTTQARITSVTGSIENGATIATTAVTDVADKLNATANTTLTAHTDLYRELTDANSGSTSGLLAKINSTQPASILAGLEALAATIDGSATETLTGDASENLIAKLGSPVVAATPTSLGTVIGKSGSLATRLGDPSSNFASIAAIIGGSGASIAADLLSLQTALGGTGTATLTSLSGSAGGSNSTIAQLLDGGAGSTSLYDRIVGSSGLFHLIDGSTTDGSSNIKVKLGAPTVNGSASNLKTLVGGTGSDIATRLGDPGSNFASIASMIGGTQSTIATKLGNSGSATLADQLKASEASVQSGITDVDAALLTTPTGVVFTDAQTINSLLNGTATGSTLQARIGAPVVNSSASNLTTLIGGTGSDIATRLGDPGSNFASIASMIGGSASTIATKLGNSGTASLADQIKPSQTSVQSAITNVDAEVLTTPTGVIETDLHSINSLLNGTASGSTMQARIGAPGSGLTSINAMIGVTSAASIAAALGNTGSGNSAIAALLGGTSTTSLYGQIVGGSGILSSIDGTSTDSGNITAKLSTQTNAVKNGATQLSTAINNVNAKFGSGASMTASTDLYSKLTDANSSSTSGILAKINSTQPASLIAGLDSLAGSIDGSASGSLTGASGTSGNLNDKLLGQITAIQGSATQLSTAIATAATALGGSGTIVARANSLTTAVGGSGSTTAANIQTATGDIENGASVLSTAISDVSTLLGSDSSLTANTDLYRELHDANSSTTSGLIAKLNGTSSTTVIGGIDAVAGTIDGSSSVTGSSSSNLDAKLVTQIQLLKGSATQLSTAINGVDAIIGGSGTTVVRLGDPSGNMSLITLSAVIGGSSTSSLFTQLGITTQSTSLADQISPSSASVQSAITAASNQILSSPSGILTSDISSLQSLLVTTPGATAEADVQTLNSLLNGTSTGSTLQARIGSPIVNGSGSNLASMIGGSELDIAGRLGDPVTGTTGLASLIKNNQNVTNFNIDSGQLSSFNNATNLNDQLSAFMTIMSSGHSVPTGTYSSLADILNAINS